MDDDIATTESLVRRLQTRDDKPLNELMERYKPHIWPAYMAPDSRRIPKFPRCRGNPTGYMAGSLGEYQ